MDGAEPEQDPTGDPLPRRRAGVELFQANSVAESDFLGRSFDLCVTGGEVGRGAEDGHMCGACVLASPARVGQLDFGWRSSSRTPCGCLRPPGSPFCPHTCSSSITGLSA